jgi:hypothetical protein
MRSLNSLRLSRRALTVIFSVGLVGLLGSLTTYGTFSARTFNSSEQFTASAGSLILSDTTGFTSASITLGRGGTGAANQSGTDPRTLSECASPTIAQVCTKLLKSTNVAAPGMAPGQYLQGTITITNNGDLPITAALQVQNVKTNNGNNSLYASGATGTTPCATDVDGAAAPGSNGPQLPAGGTVVGYGGAAVPVTGCLDLGQAVRITIQDAGAGGTGPQCLFGNDRGGGANGNNNLQAPVTGGLSTGGSGLRTYVATGSKLGVGSGRCDDLSAAGLLGRPTAPVLPGSNPKDRFGTQTSAPGNTSFAGLSGTDSYVFIPGASASFSLVNSPTFGGNLAGVPQWAPGEAHTFTITVALPDTGYVAITDANNNAYPYSADNPYQGGALSFDLYWFAIQ